MKKISEAKKKQLLKEFEAFHSIAEKFTFWEEKLGKKYIYVLSMQNPYRQVEPEPAEREWLSSLQKFWIIPKEEQNREWNTVVLKAYKDTFERFSVRKQLWDLNEWTTRFEKEYEAVKNKKEYLQHEKERLNAILQEKRNWDKGYIPSLQKQAPLEMRGFWFEYGYKRQMFENAEVELNRIAFDYPHLIEALNGVTLAKYRKYLDEKEQPQKKEKGFELSIQEQIIMSLFTGEFEAVNRHKTASDKATYFAAYFNRNPQSVREIFSKGIHKLLTPEDRKKIKDIDKSLTKLKTLFELVGRGDKAALVQAELDGLKKL